MNNFEEENVMCAYPLHFIFHWRHITSFC